MELVQKQRQVQIEYEFVDLKQPPPKENQSPRRVIIRFSDGAFVECKFEGIQNKLRHTMEDWKFLESISKKVQELSEIERNRYANHEG